MATIPNSQKTFSVNEGVNTVYGGSASMKALSQWYTMQDITDTVRPYKVYTALLMQDGIPTTTVVSYNETLSASVTYQITDNDGGTANFTNVGAPNNDEGTYFVATGEVPNSWGSNNLATLVYNKANIQSIVLENTIGDIWFNYKSVGNYAIYSSNLFTENKTTVITSPAGHIGSPTDIYNFNASWAPDGVDSIAILSYYNNEPADGAISYAGAAMIEIRVYN